jgi:hypothetical protein
MTWTILAYWQFLYSLVHATHQCADIEIAPWAAHGREVITYGGSCIQAYVNTLTEPWAWTTQFAS